MTTTIESQPAPARPAGSAPRRRRTVVAVLTTLLVAAAVVLIVRGVTGSGDGERVSGPEGAPYSISLPEGWGSLGKEELARASGHPLAVIRRDDGAGVVVIRRSGKPPTSLERFAKDLDAELKRRVPDFRAGKTRSLRIRAGQAWFYSYVRTRAGTAHTVVLVPAERRSYTINTVARGGEPEVAREIGRMIVSFDLRS